VVRRRSRIIVHSKQENKYKKRNKGERKILLGLEHNQAMPFGMVAK
jgi:hypothetical protein